MRKEANREDGRDPEGGRKGGWKGDGIGVGVAVCIRKMSGRAGLACVSVRTCNISRVTKHRSCVLCAHVCVFVSSREGALVKKRRGGGKKSVLGTSVHPEVANIDGDIVEAGLDTARDSLVDVGPDGIDAQAHGTREAV